MTRFALGLILATAICGILALSGCGSDDPSTPQQPDGKQNSLVIDITPDAVNAAWTVAGPEGYTVSGRGDRTLTDLTPGEYWAVWAEVEGYYTPDQASAILGAEGSVTFNAVYEFIGSGTIVVATSPDEIAVPWTLTGPAGFTLNAAGDSTLVEMLPGEYTLTWEELTGWIRPAAETQDLVKDATITFTGDYIENSGTGTIYITAAPDYLTPPWVLHGPDDLLLGGAGNKTLPAMTAGEYTLVWDNLSGWVAPEPEDQLLLGGGSITFLGVFEEDVAPPGFQLLPPSEVPMPVGFTMGSLVEAEEAPHQVHLTNRFFLGQTEVTNGQYVQLLQWAYDRFYVTANPYTVNTTLDSGTAQLLDLEDEDCQIDFWNGTFSTPYPNRPVIDISWYGAAAYCDWLSLYEGLPRAYNHYNWRCNNFGVYEAEGYRLPTEAEWELACRAGTTTHYYTGDCLSSDTEANYNGEYPFADCPVGPSIGHTVNVASYAPNPWDLYDMHGNVYEWCNDRYGPYSGDATDPIGPTTAINRVVRGGGFSYEGVYCRSAARHDWSPNYFAVGTGFRVARTAQ